MSEAHVKTTGCARTIKTIAVHASAHLISRAIVVKVSSLRRKLICFLPSCHWIVWYVLYIHVVPKLADILFFFQQSTQNGRLSAEFPSLLIILREKNHRPSQPKLTKLADFPENRD